MSKNSKNKHKNPEKHTKFCKNVGKIAFFIGSSVFFQKSQPQSGKIIPKIAKILQKWAKNHFFPTFWHFYSIFPRKPFDLVKKLLFFLFIKVLWSFFEDNCLIFERFFFFFSPFPPEFFMDSALNSLKKRFSPHFCRILAIFRIILLFWHEIFRFYMRFHIIWAIFHEKSCIFPFSSIIAPFFPEYLREISDFWAFFFTILP